MEVYPLYHSGFAVRTKAHLLIFDYYLDTPRGCGLSKGVIDPSELQGEDVVVFVSHRHPDHYNRRIFTWKKTLPDIRYVLSHDIKAKEEHITATPGSPIVLPDMRVEVLDSTDIGVAFLVEVDNVTIYHAGDLNWWHWDGEAEEENADMGAKYKREIDRLKGKEIDLAFVPVDSRLERTFTWGADYFMETVGAKHLVPMHFGDDYQVIDRLLAEDKPYKNAIVPYTYRGEKLLIGE